MSIKASIPNVNVPERQWIALLGRRDMPVDGVEDYCTFLGGALAARGIEMRQARVVWSEKGWIAALAQLRHDCQVWRGAWVIVQYTALSWSRRGFPILVLAVMATLRRGGLRTAVVFHESHRQIETSRRWIDRIRGLCQDWVIRRLYDAADKPIFADPANTVSSLAVESSKAAFIPIGASVPEPKNRTAAGDVGSMKERIVAVYCVDAPPDRVRQVGDVAYAVGFASQRVTRLHVVFLGKGAAEAEPEIHRAFKGMPVHVSNLGLQTFEQVSELLARSDAMICVRGCLFPTRSSALAGIACGVPIVGYAGRAEGTPLMEAGVELVPFGDRDALGASLARVLGDLTFQQELRERNARAQAQYFSWEKISDRFIAELGTGRA